MGKIADHSIDAIIADLPYGTTACSWDSVIPFEPMWKHFKRVIKDRGAVVLFGSQPFTSALVMSNPGWCRDEWIWKKNNGTGGMNANIKPIRIHENILVFYERLPTFNPQFVAGIPYRIVRNKPDINSVYGKTGTVNGFVSVNDGIRYLNTVLEFSTEVGLHPTQKPIALLEYLVKTYTNPGDTVLDCTMGSGTTGAACGRLNRRFIGIEQDPGYFAIAENRIKNAYGDYVRTPEEVEKGQLALFEVAV
jgi:site-specific DNA-methyltransferase (adenine-specific)